MSDASRDGRNAFPLASLVAIPSLNPHSPLDPSTHIDAVVTLLWPYSSKTESSAMLLAAPDMRLRNKKGQVRVCLRGAAAVAVARAQVGIGDKILLRLQGAQWAQQVSSSSVSTPGRSVDGELVFRQRLAIQFGRGDSEPVSIDIDLPSPAHSHGTPSRSASPSPAIQTPVPEQTTLRQSWSSPFTVTSASTRPLTVDPFLVALEDDEQFDNRGGKRSKFGRKSGEWRYVGQTPPRSPTPSAQVLDHSGNVFMSAVDALNDPDTMDAQVQATLASPITTLAGQPSVSLRGQSEEVDSDARPALAIPNLIHASEMSAIESQGQSSELQPPATMLDAPSSPMLKPISSSDLSAISPLAMSREQTSNRSVATAGEMFSAPRPNPAASQPSMVPLTIPHSPFSGISLFPESAAEESQRRVIDPVQVEPPAGSSAAPLTIPETPETPSFAGPKGQQTEELELLTPHVDVALANDIPMNDSVLDFFENQQVTDSGSSRPQPEEELQSQASADKLTMALSRPVERFELQDTGEDVSRTSHASASALTGNSSLIESSQADRHQQTTFANYPSSLDGPGETEVELVQTTAIEHDAEDGLQNIRAVADEGPTNRSHLGKQENQDSAYSPPAGLGLEKPTGADHNNLFGDESYSFTSVSEEGRPQRREASSPQPHAQRQDLSLELDSSDIGAEDVPRDAMRLVPSETPALHPSSEIVNEGGDETPKAERRSLEREAMSIAQQVLHAAFNFTDAHVRQQAADKQATDVVSAPIDEASQPEVLNEPTSEVVQSESEKAVPSSPLDVPTTPTLTTTSARHRVDQILDGMDLKAQTSVQQQGPSTAPSTNAKPVHQQTQDTPQSRMTQTGNSSRLRSGKVPEVLSPWFSGRKSSRTKLPHGAKLAEQTPLGHKGKAPTTGGADELEEQSCEAKQERHVTFIEPTDALQTVKDRSHGFRTALSYYAPLSRIDVYLNATASQSDSATMDIFALVTSKTSLPTRAKSGPKDHYTVLHVSDASIYPTTVQTECFRPYKKALPEAEVGDVILLRQFVVNSRDRSCYLLSTASSAWCVWRFPASASKEPADALPEAVSMEPAREECKGPPVELGDEEREHAHALRAWWASVKDTPTPKAATRRRRNDRKKPGSRGKP